MPTSLAPPSAPVVLSRVVAPAALGLVIVFSTAAVLLFRLIPDDQPIVRIMRTLIVGGVLASTLSAGIGAAAGTVLWLRGARGRVLPLALAGAVGGFILHAAVMLVSARVLDPPLNAAVNAARRGEGFVAIERPGQPIELVRRTARGSYEHTAAIQPVPERAIAIAVLLEDVRHSTRVGVIDVKAIARALWSAVRNKRLEGTSGLSAQLAGRLLNIDTRQGSWSRRLVNKARKMLAGERLIGLIPKHDIAQLYLQTAVFGNVGGHSVRGIERAARVFYGRPAADLGVAELAELIGRLPNPSVFTPIAVPGESEARLAVRRGRIARNYAAVLEHVRDAGLLTADIDVATVPVTWQPYSEAVSRVAMPRLATIFNELDAARVARHRVRLVVPLDHDLQLALDASVDRELEALIPRLRRLHPDDRAVVDATVIDQTGAILAERGLATVPGGSSSLEKPTIYGAALDAGVLPSLASQHDGVSAFDGLVHSHNAISEEIAVRLGVDRVFDLVAQEGGRPNGKFVSLVLGAGSTISPRNAAGRFAKFAPWSLGVRQRPTFIGSVEDVDTREIVYRPPRDPVLSSTAARHVQGALIAVSRRGTASSLRPLSEAAPIIVKTGSAGFQRGGTWMGEGGSHVAGCDTATRICFAFRIRWASGRPFELSASQSVVPIARRFIERARSMGE